MYGFSLIIFDVFIEELGRLEASGGPSQAALESLLEAFVGPLGALGGLWGGPWGLLGRLWRLLSRFYGPNVILRCSGWLQRGS